MNQANCGLQVVMAIKRVMTGQARDKKQCYPDSSKPAIVILITTLFAPSSSFLAFMKVDKKGRRH